MADRESKYNINVGIIGEEKVDQLLTKFERLQKRAKVDI
jgi:hypothetical protein